MAQEPRYTSQEDPYDDPYEARYASHGNPYAEPVDLDEFGSQVRSYHTTRSLATREEYLPDDSVPLFLSGAAGAPKPPRSGGRTGSSRRLLRTGILAIAATVAAFVAVSVKNPFTVFANATASLIGISDVRSTPAVAAVPVQPTTVARASSPAATQAPSRDEIALALRTAHQSQAPAEIPQPAAAAPVAAVAAAIPAPPARRLAADELVTLMTRAKSLLSSGDIPPARLLLERAAEAQEASAALMLAQTYDPAVLGTQDIRNINPDPALARIWYQRAAQLGSPDAQRRLSQLQ